MQIYAGLFYQKYNLFNFLAGEGVGLITAEDEDLAVMEELSQNEHVVSYFEILLNMISNFTQ